MVILLFGATGSAGDGVLSACLADADVTEVRAIVRRPVSVADPRLRVYIHSDYLDYTAVRSAFGGVDACFYCLGISTTQVSGESEYRKITHAYAIAAAEELKSANPSSAFHFISGRGAALDGRFMWARVKAQTEQDLMALTGAVCYRPAYIEGAGSASEPKLYKVLRPVLSFVLRPFPATYIRATDIGRAMLNATRLGLRNQIVDNLRIHSLATSSTQL